MLLECILKAIHQMTAKRKEIETLLKTYFTAGVTPEFAENPKDADILKGLLKLYRGLEQYCLHAVLNLKYYNKLSKILL